MHRFLTAFLCLSTLAMTQNVVAGTPSTFATVETRVIAAGGESAGLSGRGVRDTVGGEVPTPATTMLLVTGLAGLSAVGGRRRGAERSPRA